MLVMSRFLATGAVGLLCVIALGCGSREYSGPRRFAIAGRVIVDGQPMPMGVVSFVPQDESGKVAGGPIKDGSYSVSEANGPTAGKYQVQIYWNKSTGKKIRNPMDKDEMIDEMISGLPAKYGANSELTAEVLPKQTKFDFDLKTK